MWNSTGTPQEAFRARLRVPIDPARPDPRVLRNLERIVAARDAAGARSPRIELLAQGASGGGALRPAPYGVGEGTVPVPDEARKRETL